MRTDEISIINPVEPDNQIVNEYEYALKEVLEYLDAPICPNCSSKTTILFRPHKIKNLQWAISCPRCGNYTRSSTFLGVIAYFENGGVDGNFKQK